MTAVLVDSNVLLDVATADPTWVGWSSGMLERVADEAPLIINALVYAEVSIGFDSIEELKRRCKAETGLDAPRQPQFTTRKKPKKVGKAA
jgi:hypothetical protein